MSKTTSGTYHYPVNTGHGGATFPKVALGSLRGSLAFFWKGHGVQSPWLAVSQTYLSALEHVKQLLQDTDIPVTEIAMQSGYQNVSYFIRSFKKTYGVSPLKYRKK